jgi:hypothetical protein
MWSCHQVPIPGITQQEKMSSPARLRKIQEFQNLWFSWVSAGSHPNPTILCENALATFVGLLGFRGFLLGHTKKKTQQFSAKMRWQPLLR